jgi:hypothetical protein
MEIKTDDLVQIIGRQTVEIEQLRKQLNGLGQQLMKERESKPREQLVNALNETVPGNGQH